MFAFFCLSVLRIYVCSCCLSSPSLCYRHLHNHILILSAFSTFSTSSSSSPCCGPSTILSWYTPLVRTPPPLPSPPHRRPLTRDTSCRGSSSAPGTRRRGCRSASRKGSHRPPREPSSPVTIDSNSSDNTIVRAGRQQQAKHGGEVAGDAKQRGRARGGSERRGERW